MEEEEEKRKGSPFSLAAVVCGVLTLVVVTPFAFNPYMGVLSFPGGVVLGSAAIICAVFGYGRRERMRHWGGVGILVVLLSACVWVFFFMLFSRSSF